MPYKRDTKYVPIHDVTTIAPGALANDAVAIIAGPVIEENVFIVKSEIYCTGHNLAASGIFGIFGIADGDLTATEIAECLNADGPLFQSDTERNEQSRRRVQMIGPINMREDIANPDQFALARVVKFEHNVRMKFNEDSPGWVWFIKNTSGAAFTAGQQISVDALHHARWLE